MRQITEVHNFTKEMLAELAMSASKMNIIGNYYEGEIHYQEAEWKDDGSVVIRTAHTPK